MPDFSVKAEERALSLFERLVRQDRPEDPKRYAVTRATQGLLAAFLTLVAADAVCIVFPTPTRLLTAAAVTLTLGIGASVATLAGVAHKKPDDPLPPAPATGGDQ